LFAKPATSYEQDPDVQDKFYIQDYCAWAYFSAVGATFPVPIALTAATR
jgi:hypothetical protein